MEMPLISLSCNARVIAPSPAAKDQAEIMATFNSGYCLSPGCLRELADRYQNVYRQAKPFPHIVIDDFLPADVLEQLLDELSTINCSDWQQLRDNTDRDSVGNPLIRTGAAKNNPYLSASYPSTHWLLHQLNSEVFINFLECLTGSGSLLASPQVESSGLGTLRSDKSFKIQVNGGQYTKPLDRKLTFLIYLNKNWKEEYGGHLELWNAEMTRCEKKILPAFNRCVVFSTTDFSYYCHPDPLNCPDNETRKLLALYYPGRERAAAVTPNSHTSPELYATSQGNVDFKERSVEVLLKTFIKKLIPALSRV